MKKVVTINIAGRSFYIDEDAFDRLDQYLKNLEEWSREKESGREIFSDIEGRIRELFEARITPATGVISLNLVNEIINIMGQPEDFAEESSTQDNSTRSNFESTSAHTRRRLYRDVEDQVIGGVCSGIAAYFNIDKAFVRILFAILPFLSFGAIVPIYIILWIAIPPALTATQRLEMRGRNVNISNIEKNIRNEYYDVKNRFQNSATYRKGEKYLDGFRKRDRNAFIITAVIIGFIIITNLISIPVHLGFDPVIHHNIPFGNLSFPGFMGLFPLVLILLVLGLAFRSAMKGFLILIAIVLLTAFLLKITGAFAWPHMMHSVL